MEELTQDEAFLRSLTEEVIRHLGDERFGVEELSKNMGISRSNLHRKLKKISGESVSFFIRQVRLEEARRLLLKDVATVAEVGYRVGFNSPSYFHKCFLEKYGVSPGELKKEAKSSAVTASPEAADVNAESGFGGWRLLALLGILGIVAMAIVAYSLKSSRPSVSDVSGRKSVAVLPLDVIGDDPQGNYFSEGVREEILNYLSQIEDIDVKSRSVVDQQSNLASTLEMIAELGITHYIEGSARKEGNRVRITIQLIEAESNDHVWSENYDRPYENIWNTQSDIAQNVAQALEVSISPQVMVQLTKKPTNNSDAWDDYLKAMFFKRRYESTFERYSLEQTAHLMKSALKKDPNFALAHSSLAWAYSQTPVDPNLTFDFLQPDSILPLCNRALQLDSTLSEAYIQRGEYYAYRMDRPDLAASDFEKAIATGPNLAAPYVARAGFLDWHYWDIAEALRVTFEGLSKQADPWLVTQMIKNIGFYYLEIGEYEKAEYCFERALVRDPTNVSLLSMMGHFNMVRGNYAEAKRLAEQTMQLSPMNNGLLGLAITHMMAKEYEEAIPYFEKFYTEASETGQQTFHNMHMYGFALQQVGRVEEGEEKYDVVLNQLESNYDAWSYEYAKVYAAKGQNDSAFHHLRKAVAGSVRWGMADFMQRDPLFGSIKDTPEFQRLVGLAQEKVSEKRAEVQAMEESGEIPANLEMLNM